MAEKLCPLTFNNPDDEVDVKCEEAKCAWWINDPNLKTPICAITAIAMQINKVAYLLNNARGGR